jgi:Uma2 family endonuclease
MKQYRRGDALTAEQYERLHEDDRYISEMSRGLLVREPRPGALHSRVAFELGVLLREFVKANDLGTVEVESGFKLSESPLTIRGPDIAFIRKERLPAELPVSWWPLAPDLAIEVVSPGKTLSELHVKIFEFFEAGTREIWVVESRTRSVTVYRSLSDIAVIREPEMLYGGVLLPGLRLPLDSFLPTGHGPANR